MNIIVEKLKKRLMLQDTATREYSKHELREVTQELVMAGLAATDFFSKAAFHGGTSLRLFYNIGRYSEDLDFTLINKDSHFKWQPYLDKVKNFVAEYGCALEIKDKSKEENSVKKAFVKDSSIEQMLDLSWTQRSGTPEKISIKMEIDSNPPDYAVHEIKIYNFPIKFDVTMQDLPSLFAGKCHALLCREYEKGRDWFDLKWFINNDVEPNYKYLDSMLEQQGPWKEKKIKTDKIWLSNELINKTNVLDFNNINRDIKRFSVNNVNIQLDKDVIKNLIHTFNVKTYGTTNEKESQKTPCSSKLSAGQQSSVVFIKKEL